MTELAGTSLKLNDSSGNCLAYLSGQTANLRLGGKKADGTEGNDGDIFLFSRRGDQGETEATTATIKLEGDKVNIELSSNSEVVDETQRTSTSHSITIDGKESKMSLVRFSQSQRIGVGIQPIMNKRREITLDTHTSSLTLKENVIAGSSETFIDNSIMKVVNANGKNTIFINGDHPDGNHGAISLAHASGTNTIYLDGGDSKIRLSDIASVCSVRLDGGAPSPSITINAPAGKMQLNEKSLQFTNVLSKTTVYINGGHDEGGHGAMSLNDGAGNQRIYLNGRNGNIALKNAEGDNKIHLNSEIGDILLSNADCAEDFDISGLSKAEPGTVMVIEEEGSLRPSTIAYDKKVAGVISGAGDLRPGLILDRHPGIDGRKPVALMGKVFCKVDANYAPIEVGDLLTTSPTEGHAMKATDPEKAFGAVIGKALKSLTSGQDMIPIIVALQ